MVEYYNLAMVKSSPQMPEERIHTSFGRAEFDWNLRDGQYGTTGEHETGDKSIRYVYCILGDSVILLNLYALMRSTPIQLLQL